MSQLPPYEEPDRGYMGDRRRGASMGRPSTPIAPGSKVHHLHRVPFVDYDYDKGGAYWGGAGMPLFCAWPDEPAAGGPVFLRAPSRTDARAKLPGLRFYR